MSEEQERIQALLQSTKLDKLAHTAHLIAEVNGFHDEPYSTTGMSFNYVAWVSRQLAHLCIEVGELADGFRKEHELSLEEAADIFIVLSDLICRNEGEAIRFLEAIKEKMRKNLERGSHYGLHE